MKIDPKCKLLVHPDHGGSRGYHEIPAQTAGWNYLSFGARRMKKGERWEHGTGDDELCVVLLGGKFTLSSKWGKWSTEKGRANVFSGLPHAAYFPPETEFILEAASAEVDIAFGYTKGDAQFPGRLITPEDVQELGIEFRGGDNASRQINSILPPGSACHRLVCVEVYTPSGNWSSYPPHKHDVRTFDQKGALAEAQLEEVYFYKFDKPQGFAIQKIYTDDRSLNELAEPHSDDVVLVPKGYHPVSAAFGYNAYYLNFLAGTDQSLAKSDDPDHEWIYGTWKSMDPRIPLVTLGMNK
ncbi:MAG TPA: 5-deoxy-glucuronate isomerase [Bacteroidota bacterium]|nr:5-deoxy-glucuronate isomerase [Bacteroidota bacterium]